MFKTRKFTVGITLVVVAALALIVSGCVAGVPTAGGETRTVTVSGMGEKTSPPDLATVDLGHQAMDADLEVAMTESNQTIEAIKAALMDLGVEEKDIQTRDFNVWMDERYDTEGNPTGVSIYYVSNTVHVTVRDIAIASDVIGAGLEAGANRVLGLTFGIDETDALMTEARQLAIDDARAQAEQLAAGLGMSLGDPVAISEGGVSSPLYNGGIMMAADAGMGGAGAPPISQGELTVTSQVTIIYELLP